MCPFAATFLLVWAFGIPNRNFLSQLQGASNPIISKAWPTKKSTRSWLKPMKSLSFENYQKFTMIHIYHHLPKMLHGIKILLLTFTQLQYNCCLKRTWSQPIFQKPIFVIATKPRKNSKLLATKYLTPSHGCEIHPWLPWPAETGSVTFGHADDHQTLGKYSSFDTRKAAIFSTWE